MSSCSIKYIKENEISAALSPAEKSKVVTAFNELHLNILRVIEAEDLGGASNRVLTRDLEEDSLSDLEKLFKNEVRLGGRRFKVLNNYNVSRRNIQKDRIQSLNEAIYNILVLENPILSKYVPEDFIFIKTVKVEVYEGKEPFDMIFVDLRPILNPATPEVDGDWIKNPDNFDQLMEIMSEDFYAPKYLKKATNLADSLIRNPDGTLKAEADINKIFGELENFSDSISIYLANILRSNSRDSKFSPAVERNIVEMNNLLISGQKEINDLIEAGADPKVISDKSLERIQEITSYLRKSYFILEYLSSKMNLDIKSMLNTVDKGNVDDPKYWSTAQRLSLTLNEAAYLFDIFSPIADILSYVNNELGYSFWDKYNIVNVEEVLKMYLTSEDGGTDSPGKGLTLEEAEEVLLEIFDPNVTDIDNILVKMMGIEDPLNPGEPLFTQEDLGYVKEFFEGSVVPSHSKLIDSFSNFLSKFKNTGTELKKAHYDLLSSVIYNQSRVRFRDQPEMLARLKSKEEISKELQVGSHDIGAINFTLASTQNVDDYTFRAFFDILDDKVILNDMINQEKRGEYEAKLREVGLTITDEDGSRKEMERKFFSTIIYVDKDRPLAELEDGEDWDGPVLEAYGKKFKARKGYAFKKQYNYHDKAFELKAHNYTKNARAAAVNEFLGQEFDVASPETYADILSLISRDVLYKSASGHLQLKPQFIEKYEEEGADLFVNQLDASFYDSFSHLMSYREAGNKFKGIGITNIDDLVSALNDRDFEHSFFLKRNLYGRKAYGGTDVKRIYKNKLDQNASKAFDESGVIVQYQDGTYAYVEGTLSDKGLVIDDEDPENRIEKIIELAGEFRIPDPRFENLEYEALMDEMKSNPKMKSYYDFILKEYETSNKNLGDHYLSYGLLPHVAELETTGVFDKIKKGKIKEAAIQFAENHRYNDPTVDKNNVRKQEGGHTYRELVPDYVFPLNAGLTQSGDLFQMMTLFEPSSRMYKSLSEFEAVGKVFLATLRGNSMGVTARTVKDPNGVKAFMNKFLNNSKAFEESSPLSSRYFQELFENRVYGYRHDTRIGSASLRKIAGSVKTLTAYQVLAHNWKATVTNLLIGNLETFIMSVGKRYGLSHESLRNSWKHYLSNVLDYAMDEFKPNVSDTSLSSQLMGYFDIFKGNQEEGREQFSQHKIQEKIAKHAFFGSTSLPEHVNQGVLFLAIWEDHEVLPGRKLKEFVSHTNGKMFTWDLEAFKKAYEDHGKDPKEVNMDFFRKYYLNVFQRKVTRAMYETQGQYDKKYRNFAEINTWLSLAYQFSRWMYPGLRSKFVAEGEILFDSGQVEEEGYLRTYAKYMIAGNDKIMQQVGTASFYMRAQTYMKEQGIVNMGQLYLSNFGKATIGSVMKLSANMFNEPTPNLDKWLFSGVEETNDRIIDRLNRAYTFMGVFVSTFLLGIILAAIADSDGDPEDDKFLKFLELQARRLNNDLGFYVDPFTFLDKAILKYRDPLTIFRPYESISGVLKQLFLYEVNEDGLDMRFNDVYERDGVGYKEGDSKLWVKTKKTFLSFLVQYSKLFNPQQELNYMDMVYRN